MKRGNEHKISKRQRLLNFLVKPIPEEKEVRSKPPVHKFQYQLPSSFFQAVNEARVEAGYDVLPHFHNLSLSSFNRRRKRPKLLIRPSEKHNRFNQRKNARVHFTPTSNVDQTSTKRNKSRRTDQKHSHQQQQQQHQKNLIQHALTGPLSRKTVSSTTIRRPSN